MSHKLYYRPLDSPKIGTSAMADEERSTNSFEQKADEFATPKVTHQQPPRRSKPTSHAAEDAPEKLTDCDRPYKEGYAPRPTAPVPNSCERWKSEPNVNDVATADDTIVEQFEELSQDLNPTLDETQLKSSMPASYYSHATDLGLSSDLHRTTNSYHSGLPTSSTLAPSYSSGFGAHRRMAHSISHGALHGPSVSHSSEFRPIRHAYESSYLTTDYSNINSNISGSSYTAGVPLRRSAASTMPAHTHTIGNGFSSPAYTGDVSSYNKLADPHFGTTIPMGSASDNLDTWQRKHQEQLRLQQRDILATQKSFNQADPEAVQQVADQIIDRKDAIIERLNTQLTELMDRQPDNKHIQRKLGKVEYEYDEFKQATEKKISRIQFENEELANKLKKQTSEALMWHKKCGELQELNNEQSDKISSIERYMSDLPTNESRQEHAKQLKQLQEEKSRCKCRILELERRLGDANKLAKQREDLCKMTQQENELLIKKIDLCKNDLEKYRSRLDSKGPSQDAFDDCKAENDILKKQLESAKKLLDSMQKQKQDLELQHTAGEKDLQHRLSQEECTVEALRQEGDIKDKHLAKLRASVKQLGSQNQELMNQKLTLQEQVHDLETLQTGDMYRMQKRLYKELDMCFSSLHSLVQICLQQSEGQDPNMSLLLGAHSLHTLRSVTDDDKMDRTQGLKYLLSQSKELRKDIDELRKRISDKVADDMSGNVTCAQQ